MIFRAYECRGGGCLLVPACLVPSREAECRHGPLRALGEVEVDRESDAALRQRILADIDRQSYAVLRAENRPRLLSDRRPRTQVA